MSEQQKFKLTKKQSEALDLFVQKEITNLMLYGGSRAAKTFLACYIIFLRAAKTTSRHAILRDKFNHAKRSLAFDTIPKMMSIAMPDMHVHLDRSNWFYKFPNGSEVWIGGLDSKERTEKILGTEYSTLFFNETSQIDYASVLMAKTRLAEKNTLVKKCFYDSNPPQKSSWQYCLFEKKLDPIDNEPLSNPENYASFLMNPIDNIENIDKNYIKILESMPEQQKNRFLYGLYSDETDGQAYYEFRHDQVVRPVKRKPGTTFIATDFNVDPHSSIAFNFIDGKIQIFKEFYLRNSDTPKAVKAWNASKLQGSIVIPDSTGKNRKTSGQSDFDIIKQDGYQIRSAQNPFVKDRVNNVNRCLKHGLIVIDPSCKKLINDLERVSWKDNKLDPGTDKMLGHISDALGYACHNLLPQTKMNLNPYQGRR